MPPSGLEDLIHEATLLYSFVRFIHSHCESQRNSRSYVTDSAEFFNYVSQSAQQTFEYIHSAVDATDPERIQHNKKRLLTLKHYWATVHALLKPATDAHTLTVPAPLLQLAVDLVKQISEFSSPKVILLLTPELMYFQQHTKLLRDVSSQLQSTVPRIAFPPEMGLVRLPFSQGPRLFTNLVIFHEIGHFIFEELTSQIKHSSRYGMFVNALETSIHKLAISSTVIGISEQLYLKNLYLKWADEVFSDLFATRLIGPAYSFAFLEFTSLLHIDIDVAATCFTQSHPAPAYRLRRQLEQLDGDGYRPDHPLMKNSYAKRITEISAVDTADYRIELEGMRRAPEIIQEFCLLEPQIDRFVKDLTDSLRSSPEEYTRIAQQVTEHLSNGIVPSTTAVSERPDRSTQVALLNCAFNFYLTDMKRLGDLANSPNTERVVESKEFWLQRTEMWTLKAIQDLHLREKIATYT